MTWSDVGTHVNISSSETSQQQNMEEVCLFCVSKNQVRCFIGCPFHSLLVNRVISPHDFMDLQGNFDLSFVRSCLCFTVNESERAVCILGFLTEAKKRKVLNIGGSHTRTIRLMNQFKALRHLDQARNGGYGQMGQYCGL